MLISRRRRRNSSESASAVYLAFTTQPGTSGASPYTLSPQPVVAAKKSKGTTDTAKSGTVTIALVVLTGAASLSGTTTKALSSGVADFSANGLTVTATSDATWYLVASLSGLTSATSVTGTTTSGFTPYDLQLNFRWSPDGSNGGVVIADGAGQDYVLPTDTYTGSAIRGTGVWGYTTNTGLLARDRASSSLTPPQLCGVHFCDGTNNAVFRVNLPAAGTYNVRVALGDYANGVTVNKFTVQDGATVKAGGSDFGSTVLSHWKDATGADRYVNNTGAGGGIGWVETNAAVSCVFSGTTLTMTLDKASEIAALRITRTA